MRSIRVSVPATSAGLPLVAAGLPGALRMAAASAVSTFFCSDVVSMGFILLAIVAGVHQRGDKKSDDGSERHCGVDFQCEHMRAPSACDISLFVQVHFLCGSAAAGRSAGIVRAVDSSAAVGAS